MKIIEGTMNASKYTEILSKHILKSVTSLKPNCDFIFQQDNNLKHKHSSGITTLMSRDFLCTSLGLGKN